MVFQRQKNCNDQKFQQPGNLIHETNRKLNKPLTDDRSRKITDLALKNNRRSLQDQRHWLSKKKTVTMMGPQVTTLFDILEMTSSWLQTDGRFVYLQNTQIMCAQWSHSTADGTIFVKNIFKAMLKVRHFRTIFPFQHRWLQ